MTATAAPAAEYAIVVNGAAHGVPVPSNSSLVVVGPCADHNVLRELLFAWFDQGERGNFAVPYYIRKVAGPAEDLARTADNAVIYDAGNGNYLAGWTNDAGYAAHPYVMFSDGGHPASVVVEEIATMYRVPRRPGFPRGAWVIEREPDGAELAVLGNKPAALAKLREVVAAYFAEAAAA